jgi:23S rRNA (cytidine1920-2'-O)/16S rRNA (cytidine1409-2'-O)-methyltransferase
MGKKRLGELLVELGHARDHKEAAAIALSGAVLVNGQKVDKVGTRVDSQAEIQLIARAGKYVSRGGLKLEAAIKAFALDVSKLVCLDLGASTGGFTDCLLKFGARRVYAFDVGKGQLDWDLQNDPRVIVRDNFNVRYLRPSILEDKIDLVTADLSFISLKQVLPALKRIEKARFLVLVKPQFEAMKGEVAKGGLIRSESKRLEIVERVKEFARRQGFEVAAEMLCPIPGQKGNREYFLLLEHAAL